jgi:hypothetical protein
VNYQNNYTFVQAFGVETSCDTLMRIRILHHSIVDRILGWHSCGVSLIEQQLRSGGIVTKMTEWQEVGHA